MTRIALIIGVLLIAIGTAGYLGDSPSDKDRDSVRENNESAAGSAVDPADKKGKRSVTALIPAFTGALLLIFGGLALIEGYRRHAMHAAAVVGILGFLAAGGRSITGLLSLVGGDDVNLRSLFFVSSMAILCGTFVVLCVASFVQARRNRDATSAATAS